MRKFMPILANNEIFAKSNASITSFKKTFLPKCSKDARSSDASITNISIDKRTPRDLAGV